MGELFEHKQDHVSDSGFVLVTSLIMLSLLTLMSVAMYYASRSGTQISAAAQSSTEAYYYTETAIHYMFWAKANDAEFDNHSFAGSYVAAPFGEPAVPTNANAVGDFTELDYKWDPGPTGVAGSSADDTSAAYISGQVMYFDNSPMANRYLCMESYLNFSNCLDVSLSPGDTNRKQPSMFNISAKLPRYIKLDIASDGVVTPSIPPLPHADPPVVGEDIPLNGAIVWLTAVDANNTNRDIEIYPLTPALGSSVLTDCNDGTLPNCPCTALPMGITPQACEANTPTWVSDYGIAAYAIGYVNGKASHLIRAVLP